MPEAEEQPILHLVGSTRPDATKFRPPRLPRNYVARPRLARRLDDLARAPVAVVCAPAGSGKSVSLSSWATGLGERCAWLTLDDRDNDYSTLWAHLDHAFDASRSHDYLVLDGAQCLLPSAQLDLLPLVVAELPSSVHLLVAGRSLAPFALHRLRVERNALELDARDLRFTVDEAAALFADPAHTGVDIPGLVEHTDGWATGLALAMVHEDATRVEQRAHEFLRDEVFAKQPDDIQHFLMETAFLEYMSAAAGERITKRPDAADVIRNLARDHAFVSRVDGDSRYVYQGQFRAMLREELQARDPARVDGIHVDSARWCEEHGHIAEAMEHWLRAGRAHDALLLLRSANLRFGDSRLDLIRSWIARIDTADARGEPQLLLDLAASCASIRDDVRCRDALVRAATARRGAPDPVLDVRTALLGARHALGAGDIESYVARLERARSLLAADPALVQDPVLTNLPRARRVSGWLALGQSWLEQTEAARATLRDRPFSALEDAVDRTFVASVESAVAFNEGHLEEAATLASFSTRTAADLELDGHVVWPATHVLAAMMQEQDDLIGARLAFEDLIRAVREPSGNAYAIAAQVTYANVLRSQGDVAEALELLWRIRRERAPEAGSTTGGWIDRATVLALLRLGQIGASREILGPPHSRDSESVTAALIELADGRADEAARLAAALRRDAPRPRLLAALIDAQVAVLRGDADATVAGAEQAKRVAQTHGFVRTVIDYGGELLPVFEAISAGADDAQFVARLRRAQRQTPATIAFRQNGTSPIELTARELDVLRYLPTQLSLREIGHVLYVSPNTVKTHAQHLYRKLGVDSREAAVERSLRLHLFR